MWFQFFVNKRGGDKTQEVLFKSMFNADDTIVVTIPTPSKLIEEMTSISVFFKGAHLAHFVKSSAVNNSLLRTRAAKALLGDPSCSIEIDLGSETTSFAISKTLIKEAEANLCQSSPILEKVQTEDAEY